VDEALEYVAARELEGYEGGIFRALDGKHKDGYSSPTHRGLLRAKTFIHVDARVLRVLEGQSNQNEATTNLLGHTERSTHQANMVPNGMVGTVVAELLEDAKHPTTGKLLHQKGEIVDFGAGRMDHGERALFFREPHRIVGKIMRGKIFTTGIKDKPRFPTYQNLRSEEDFMPA